MLLSTVDQVSFSHTLSKQLYLMSLDEFKTVAFDLKYDRNVLKIPRTRKVECADILPDLNIVEDWFLDRHDSVMTRKLR